MLIFAQPYPDTPGHALGGLGGTVVMLPPGESRPPGRACWLNRLPPTARLGDHVLFDHVDDLPSLDGNSILDTWVRCRTVADVRLAGSRGIGVWLCGSEAGGKVGRTTTLVLIRALYAINPKAKWVAEGLTAGARAASMAVGAAGMVLDSQLWFTTDSPIPEDIRALARRVRARERTWTNVGGAVGHRLLHHAPTDTIIPFPASLTESAKVDGTRAQVIRKLRRDAQTRMEQIRRFHAHTADADPLNTGTPIVQGPMANISEGAALPRALSAAGVQPFVALAAMRPHEAERLLAEVEDVERCGAGLIAFDVAPHRDAHVDALVQAGPRPVIIAGGTPQFAKTLALKGLEPWLHTPSSTLAKLALRAGVRAIVLEGHEAGGHVGKLSSATLWDEAMSAICSDDRIPGNGLIVLAGGIGDAVSSAFAAAIAAPARAAGHRVALQVGTAWLMTKEAVDGGHITPQYQSLAAHAEGTVLVGESVGLPLRCVPNGFTETAIQSEQEWMTEGLPLDARRVRMETLNVGRTRIAARSEERDPDWDGVDQDRRRRPVASERALHEGAFSVGQGVAVHRSATTVRALVRDLTSGAKEILRRSELNGIRSVGGAPILSSHPEFAVPLARQTGNGSNREPIAIVGLGCVLPGGEDVIGWWRSQVSNVQSIREIPTSRWDPELYWSSEPASPGRAKSRSRLAGVAPIPRFDPMRYRIPPRTLPTIDTSQRLALLAGDEALGELRSLEHVPTRERSAVILGNAMGGEWRSKLALRVRYPELGKQLNQEGLDALDEELDQDLVPVRPESMVGLLGNLIAGRLAAWLDWEGGSHTVDAACAASLLGVVQAVDALRAGRIDLALTGGIDTDLSIDTFVGFSQTHALSSAGSRPFSRDADGFVMGEGAAVFALTRLSDATRLGLPVWALIRGVGTSSDGRGRGLTAPSARGQRLAISRAWEDAKIPMSDACYIEAHGTGTTLGDQTELSVLSELFPGRWVSTAKGSIGHLKSGAGAAGILRATLAAATGFVPPTMNVGPPVSEGEGLKIPRYPVAHGRENGSIGVSAFGFGGTNAHIVLSPAPAGVRRPQALSRCREEAARFARDQQQAGWTITSPSSVAFPPASDAVALYAGRTLDELIENVTADVRADIGTAEAFRLAVTGPLDRIATTRHHAAIALSARKKLPRGTYFGRGTRPIAIIAPGQGAQDDSNLDTVLEYASANAAYPTLCDALESDLRLPSSPDTLDLHRHIFGVSALWISVLQTAGISPLVTVGHSLGEFAALAAAGCATVTALAPAVLARGRALHQTPAGAMLAVFASLETATTLTEPGKTWISASNSASLQVVSGTDEAIVSLAERLKDAGIKSRQVPVSHPFHTPLMSSAQDPLRSALEPLSFDDGPWHAICPGTRLQSLIDALVNPVLFASTLERAIPREAFIIELGPGKSLTPHARAAGYDAVSLGAPKGHPAAALWAHGHPGLLQLTPGIHLIERTGRREALSAAALGEGPQPDEKREPGSLNSVADSILSALIELTGYPERAILASSNLETDLGIDSVQRMELISILQDQHRFSLSASDERSLDNAGFDTLVSVLEQAIANVGRPQTTVDSVTALRPAWVDTAIPCTLEIPVGTSTHDDIQVMRLDLPTDPVEATARTLESLMQLPGSTRKILFVVTASPPGKAASAAARCMAAERGWRLTTLLHPPDSRPRLPAATANEPVLKWNDNSLLARRWVPSSATEGAAPPKHLLVSGGVSGIMPDIARAFDPGHVTFLGRRSHDEIREILESRFPEASYIQVDLATPQCIDILEGQLGSPVDMVLHGAGILRDRRSETLTREMIQRVFEAKHTGYHHLRAACPKATMVAISSIAAHIGSPNQAAYAAANAALEADAEHAITLTAIDGPGMASSPKVIQALRARGMTPLPMASACAIVSQMGAGTYAIGPDLQAIGSLGPFLQAIQPGERHLLLRAEHPAFNDHQVRGTPIVPAAIWIAEALQFGAPIANFTIERRCPVPDSGASVILDPRGSVFDGDIRFATWSTTTSTDSPSPPKTIEPTIPAASLYERDRLFHGEHWQVLHLFSDPHAESIHATLRPGSTEVQAIDACFQLLAIVTAERAGQWGLPSSTQLWERIRLGHPSQIVLSVGRPGMADAFVLGSHGEVLVYGQALKLTLLPRPSEPETNEISGVNS